MTQVYNRLNPADSTSQWDFSKYEPDIVVINLFQNDSWLLELPEHPKFQRAFGNEAPNEIFITNAYQQFVTKIRKAYPNAKIICALGNMDATEETSKWPIYIEKAVVSLNDANIYTHFFPYKNTPGHPSIKEQEAMSKSLITFIDDNIDW